VGELLATEVVLFGKIRLKIRVFGEILTQSKNSAEILLNIFENSHFPPCKKSLFPVI
jgi:hypothetical protein